MAGWCSTFQPPLARAVKSCFRSEVHYPRQPLRLMPDGALIAAAARLKPPPGDAASPPLCPARHRPQSVAACLSIVARRILSRMGTKSRETIYGASVRAAAERATEARKLITHQTEVLVHDAHNLHRYVGLNTHVVSVFLKLP